MTGRLIGRKGGGGVVLDLLLIGLAITLEPFPVTAFILVLATEKGTGRAWRSSWAGWRAWWS